jgi:uncharacterized FAD-dependent dehydrogenase
VEIVDIILPLAVSEDQSAWRDAAAEKLKIAASRIKSLKLRKHSIDARQRTIKVQLRLELGIDAELPADQHPAWTCAPLAAKAKTAVIIGCGPAGMFAALRCLERGIKPIILERGKDASARRFDLARQIQTLVQRDHALIYVANSDLIGIAHAPRVRGADPDRPRDITPGMFIVAR